MLPATLDAEAARARGRAAPGGGVRRARRSPHARSRSARRVAAAERARADPHRDRRRPVARPVLVAARSRSRCGGSTRARSAFSSHGGWSRAAHQSELERALGADRVRRVLVGPLSAGRAASVPARSARKVVRAPDAAPDPRAVGRESVLRAGAGTRSPVDIDPLQPLAVPETVEELVSARISALPRRTRDALAIARRRGHDVGVSARACGRLPRTRSTPAVAAHVIERENGMIRFTHPLLSSVLYADLGEGRRSVHARIADDRRRSAPPRPSHRALDGRRRTPTSRAAR